MNSILDLRPKNKPDLVIVEKIVEKKKSFFRESFKTLSSILLVLMVVWGISKADNTDNVAPPPNPAENLTGIYGTVVTMSGDSLTLDDSQGSQYPNVDLFNVNLQNTKTVETNDDKPLPIALSDIKAGDKIIARGIIDGSNLSAVDVISFTYTPVVISTTTIATSTIATSTTDSSTSTPDVVVSPTSTDASSTTPSGQSPPPPPAVQPS